MDFKLALAWEVLAFFVRPIFRKRQELFRMQLAIRSFWRVGKAAVYQRRFLYATAIPEGLPMNTPTPTSVNEKYAHSGEGKPSVAQIIAAELARIDGYDPEDENGGLYDVRWSGGPCPEPEGDAWNMDYLPKGERIARELERSESLERKHEQSEPDGEVVVTRDAAGAIVAVTRQDSEGRILSTIATAPPPSEQAGISEEVRRHAIAIASKATGRAWDQLTTSEVDCAAALQSAFPRGVDTQELEAAIAATKFWQDRAEALEIQLRAHPAPEAQAEKSSEVKQWRWKVPSANCRWMDGEPNEDDRRYAALDNIDIEERTLYLHPQPSASETPSADAWFAFPGDAIAHVYKAKWDAERGLYVSNDPPMVTHPMQEPVGHVRKHTGEFKDMAIIVWTNEQPPEGAALYLGPSAHSAEVNEPYPYRWRKPGQRWQYMRHPNREAFNEVMRDLKECGFEVERTRDFDVPIAAQRKGES